MRKLKENKGVALVLVLASVAILAAFSSEFAYRNRVNIHIGTNIARDIQAYYHARSAMEVVRLVITSQKFVDNAVRMYSTVMPGVKISTFELWPFACKLAEVFNTGTLNFLGVDLVKLKDVEGIGVEKGGFSCEIIPEDSKININKVRTASEKKLLVEKLYALFRKNQKTPIMDEDDRRALELILNIIDWVDPDDARSDIDSNGNLVEAGGAGENFYYAKYKYRAKNAKFDTNDELRLVEGMDDELFCRYGENITVYNTEKINVNEADIELLKALICHYIQDNAAGVCNFTPYPVLMPIDIAGAYLEMCRMIKKALFLPMFNNETEFLNFFQRLPPPLNEQIRFNQNAVRQMIGVRSRVLRVKAKGFMNQSVSEITGVIDTQTARYIYWRE